MSRRVWHAGQRERIESEVGNALYFDNDLAHEQDHQAQVALDAVRDAIDVEELARVIAGPYPYGWRPSQREMGTARAVIAHLFGSQEDPSSKAGGTT